jgi:hypothetical protein
MLEGWQEAIGLVLLLLLELVRMRRRREWGCQGPLYSLPPAPRDDEVPTDPGPIRRGKKACGVCEGRSVVWDDQVGEFRTCYGCSGKGRV